MAGRERVPVREESHLDDMRAAIRGDFERLEERRGEQELMRVADEEPAIPEPEPQPEAHPEPAPEPNFERPEQDVLEPPEATELEPAAQAAEGAPEPSRETAQPEPESDPRGEAEDPEPRSWFDRLLGR